MGVACVFFGDSFFRPERFPLRSTSSTPFTSTLLYFSIRDTGRRLINHENSFTITRILGRGGIFNHIRAFCIIASFVERKLCTRPQTLLLHVDDP